MSRHKAVSLRTLTALIAALLIGACASQPQPVASPTSRPATPVPATPIVPTPKQPPDPPTARPTRVTATPRVDPSLLLPDLQTLPPSDLVIELNSLTDRKVLRFSNSILNSGPGALESLGEFNPETGKTDVTQHIFRVDGSIEERAAGEFVFHPGHNHWHLEDFALYEVWSLTPEGDLDTVVAFTDKLSYCLRDNTRADMPDAPPRPFYTECNQELQGISVGWIDTYKFDTPGQIVDISDVPDGMYALRSTVDPDNHLQEMDDTNNAAAITIEIDGNRVRVIESASALKRLLNPDN